MLARYPGRCDECERAIHPGDAITPTEDGDWTHEKCTPPPDPLAITGTICPACWLTQPCDCEDQT